MSSVPGNFQIKRLAAALALSLPVLAIFAPASFIAAPALADEPLRGGVEETGAAPIEPEFKPAVPMPVPVTKKKLKGNADDNALKGNAEDSDGKLKDMNGLLDDVEKLKGSAQEDGGPLKATVSQDDGGNLQSADPDAEDQMLSVEWDKWHNRLLWSVQSGVTEIVNNPANMEPHFDQARGKVIMAPNIPLGTKATFYMKVDNQRRVLDAKILQSSGNQNYDKALLDAIYSLDGSSILRYPSGSKRRVVNEAATIFTSDRGGREYFKFGDVEKYRAP